MSTCSVDGCGKRIQARGWCAMHYSRWQRAQGGLRKAPIERLFEKIDRSGPGGCWIWMGTFNGKGYGNFSLDGRVIGAHRAAYLLLVGEIPPELTDLDHLCRVTACVNPEHLEPVTHAENMRRGNAPGAIVARSGRCTQGHELTPDNLYLRPDGKGSSCLICIRRRSHANNAKRKTLVGRPAS